MQNNCYFCTLKSDLCRRKCIILYMDRQSAYTQLLHRHRAMVWRMCWRAARGNWARCNDLAQEVSIMLWLHFDALRADASPAEERSWVYWQCRSSLYQQRRRQKPSMLSLTALMEETLADDNSLQQKEEIEHLIASLPYDDQQLVRLHLDGYHADEIASLMNLSRDAVYQRLHRIIVRARRVVVLVLLVLLASGLAVAVVPQWRSAVFGGAVHQEENHEPQHEEPATRRVAPLNEEAPDMAHEVEPEVLPAIVEERMPDADVLIILSGINDRSDTMPPVLSSLPPEPTIWVNGNRLIITGVYDEPVKVYQKSGVLVSSQVCHGFCVIDLFPRCDMDYRILVGRRPAVTISL